MSENKKLTTTVIEGVPGSGKTQTMLTEMLSSCRLYLLASPRVDLIQEQARFVERKAEALNIPMPTIQTVYREGRRKSVAHQMAEAAQASSTSDHAMVFITHEALMANDLDLFKGWNAGIDEVPDGTQTGCFSASAICAYLDNTYRLEPVGDNRCCHVTLRSGAPSLSEVMRDGFVGELSKFHKLVSGPQSVFVDVTDWQQARDNKRKVHWWSVWPPLSLDGFASVTMTGANVEKSLWYLTAHRCFGDQVSFKRRVIEPDGARAAPRVRVRYFTRSHSGTTTFWDESRGRSCLNKIARYFENSGGVGFWSGNEVVQKYMEHRFLGEAVSPKQAGTNGLIDHTSCAMIYSNKAQDNDQAILKVFGFEKDVIREAREIEDIIQFVMRGAIRRPDYDGQYDIYVYDSVQARAISHYLRRNGISVDLTEEPVAEAGILDEERESTQARSFEPTCTQTSAELEDTKRRAKDAVRQRRCTAKKRAKKVEDGTLRSRGRPRKDK